MSQRFRQIACTLALLTGAAPVVLAQNTGAYTRPGATPTDKQRERALERARLSAEALVEARVRVAAGDTSGALKVLERATARDNENGPLWYAAAVLLAEQSRPGWRKGIMPGRTISRSIAADSAFALAMRWAPDSVRYGIDYAAFLWGARASNEVKATSLGERAFDELEGGADTVSLGRVVNQLGIMLWRSYQPLIGNVVVPMRGDLAGMATSDGRTSAGMLQFAHDHPIPPYSEHLADFHNETLRYFHVARTAMPDVELYFRHEAMLLADFNRWVEAERVAREQLARRPQQPWPWLVLGLSEHRQGRSIEAQAAFDSGFLRLPPHDRARFSSISRLLNDAKVHWYDTLSTPAKNALHEMYWNAASPSLLLPFNPRYAEFRARVVFAELCFTDDEKPMSGIASEKGEVYICYGPPDYQIGGSSLWLYARELLHFQFEKGFGSGTYYLTPESATDLEHYRSDWPSTWSNVAAFRNRIDSMSAQVARFRGTADSVDVAIFAGIRLGALRRSAPVDSSRIRHGVFVVDALGRELSHVTGTITSAEQDTVVMQPENYFVRTTAAARAVRIEALEPDLLQVARTVVDVSGFATRGFGVSDLLVAATVTPPASRSNARWNDYAIGALTGSRVPRGMPLNLLWECYDAAQVDGTSHLRFAVSVQRETHGGLVAMAARVAGGLRDAVARNAGGTKELTIRYDRELSAAPVLVDNLQLDVGRLEPGRYRVSLAVMDLTTKATVTRVQRFVVVE